MCNPFDTLHARQLESTPMKKKTEVPTCPIHEKPLRCVSCMNSRAGRAMHKKHGNRVGFSKPGYRKVFARKHVRG